MEVHTQLLKQLKNIEKAKKAVVVDAVLEDLEKKEQFEMFSDADVSMFVNTGFCFAHQIPVIVDHSWHSREWVGA